MTLYMPLFRKCTTLRTLTQLHAHFFITNLHKDPLASTKLIESYAKMGDLFGSKLVFDTFPNPDSFMYGVLIKSYVWNYCFKDAILLYNDLLCNQVESNGFVFPSILRACSGFRDLGIGEGVHGRLIKSGFESDSMIETSLLYMYGEMGCLDDARKVFDEMLVRDVVSWSSIISCYVQNGRLDEGLEIFRESVIESVDLDSVIMICIVEACSELGNVRLARSVHGYILRHYIETDGSLGNSLIVMYSKCGDVFSSEMIFKNAARQNVSSWTAIISSYNQNGCFRKALENFVGMLEAEVKPNEVTMMSVLGSCVGLCLRNEGKSIHCFIIRNVIDPDFAFLGPTLIQFYAECGEMSNCEKVLGMIREKRVVSWNMIISVYAQKGLLTEALNFFQHMHKQGFLPDSYTLSSALSICATISLSHLGHQIHCHVIKTAISTEYVSNSLIDMYSKNGFVYKAYEIFNKIPLKSVVAWNSMICGFSQNGNSEEALHLFDQMYLNSLEMNDVTFLSAIQACSNIGYLKKGKWLHHRLIVCSIEKDTRVETALIDMYAKCGHLQMAKRVFDSMFKRTEVSWSAMIAGYGMHGQIEAAISLFTEMVETKIKPNEVTFMNILSACGHAGYVEEGKSYFHMMQDFGIKPNSEHYACIIDLLSRAGDLDAAHEIIKSMPYSADASLWGAIVNGCRIHQRMDLIEKIDFNLLDVDTDDTGYYTSLSNVYAEGGNWDKFRKVRSKIRSIGLRKVPGYSSMEFAKKVY